MGCFGKLKRAWKTRTCAAVLLPVLLLNLASCGQNYENDDILTQKKTAEGKTQITVLVKYAFTINSFEEAVEAKFPNIDLVQVGNYTRDMGITEYESRLENDDLTDIVMTWPLDVGEEYWEDRLLDLSGMDFTSKYNLSMLDSISRDGKLYYLPGPAQVRGIVYNKTMFEEKGWKVPEDFDGFVSLCQTIEASGIRSLQLGFGNSEVLDTAFIGYGYGDCYSKPLDSQWITEYNKGIGSFGDHFLSALETFQKMIDAGIFRRSDLDVTYSDRETMLFTRQCAMAEDSVLMARMGYGQTGTTDEFALMPYFNPGGEDNDWARLYMVCFIGLNKHLAETQNKEKYDMVMQIMDYISTPEGQEALMGDTGAMYSSLNGVAAPAGVEEIEELLPALEHGRYAVFPELKNAQGALRQGLAGMLSGELTQEEVVQMVDAQNKSAVAETVKLEILGTSSADFSYIETGNFVADAMRTACGSDLALFLDNGKDGLYNGKGISARFYEGDLTMNDIWRVLPDLKHGETGTLWKVTMSGEDLLTTLEYSITVDNNVSGWFYYFSGLKMTCDPTAQPGSRIKSITMEDGTAVEPEKVYSIAVMDETVPEDLIQSCEKTEITIESILKQKIRAQETIFPSGDGRFVLQQ